MSAQADFLAGYVTGIVLREQQVGALPLKVESIECHEEMVPPYTDLRLKSGRVLRIVVLDVQP